MQSIDLVTGLRGELNQPGNDRLVLDLLHPEAEVSGARKYFVVLRQPDGSVFAVAQVDDFDLEVELLKNNPEFMAFMKQLSQEKPTISLQDLRKELDLEETDLSKQ